VPAAGLRDTSSSAIDAILLSTGGVLVEAHLTPGAPHEFDVVAYQSDAAHRAVADRVRVLRSL